MKIAISNIAWEKSEDAKIAKILQLYNIQGVEIAPTKIWPEPTLITDRTIRSYAKFWTDQNIKIVATQSLLFGQPELTIFENQTTRQRTLDYLKHMIRVSAALGAKKTIFGSPKNRVVGQMDSNRATEIAVNFFTELGKCAKDYDLFFCIEPNAKDYGTDFITNTDEGITLVEAVDHSNFRLHLDAGVMTLNQENYQQSIEQALPYLCHFHISEPFLELTGTRGTNHTTIAKTLKSVNYQSWISIEMKNNLLDSNLEAVEKSMDFVTKIY